MVLELNGGLLGDLRTVLAEAESNLQRARAIVDSLSPDLDESRQQRAHDEQYADAFAFLTEQVKEFKRRYPGLTDSSQKPGNGRWIIATSKIQHVRYKWLFSGDRYVVEIHIDTPSERENDRVFRAVRSASSQVEAELGHQLHWSHREGVRVRRIQLIHDEPADENTDGLIDWGATTMKSLNDAIMPVIRDA